MRIQFLGGGLANQIRQYVFVRYAERCFPEEKWLFDDTFFFTTVYPYELEKAFGIKPNLMSTYFDADTWKNILRQREKEVSMPQILLNAGIPVVLVQENPQWMYSDGIRILHHGFDPNIISLPYKNVYYHVYGIEDQWFRAYQEENRSEFVFPALKDTANQVYAEQICSCMSIGIHVRRGDFVKLGWAAPNADFEKSCRHVLDIYPNARFFIFSDDLEWCRRNAKELGFDLAAHTVYVAGNSGEKSYIDMQLLSMCRGIIRPEQSSFSQVAAWLDRNLEIELKIGEIFYG